MVVKTFGSAGSRTNAFRQQMFKPKDHTRANLGKMKQSDARKEYTRMAKIVNKRIKAIEKAGYYSHALEHLKQDRGISRFGIKNEGITSDKELRKHYREMMDFMSKPTSSKTGIREVIETTAQNFGMEFNGDYVGFSQKSKKVFELWEDIRELEQHGGLSDSSKYDIVHDLSSLYDDGVIDENTTAEEVLDTLKQMAESRKASVREVYAKMKFSWFL